MKNHSLLQSISTTIKLFWPYLWHPRTRIYLFASFMVMLVDIFATTYLPFCLKDITNHLDQEAPFRALATSLLLFGFVFTLTKTAGFLQHLLFYPVINHTIQSLHFNITNHIHLIPFETKSKLSTPETISILKRIGFSVPIFMRVLLISIIPTICKVIASFWVVWQLNLGHTYLLLHFGFTLLCLYGVLQNYLYHRKKAWETSDWTMKTLGDSILNTQLVRFHYSAEKQYLQELTQKEANIWFKTTLRMDLGQTFLGLLLSSMMVSLVALGTYRVSIKAMDLGDFILLYGQLSTLIIPVRQLLQDIRQFLETSTDLERILNLLQIPAIHTLPLEKKVAHNTTWISFKNVYFKYNSKPLINNLSFDLQLNQKVLLLGRNGAGKSTLLRLMTGLLRPQAGEVKLFGLKTDHIDLETIGQKIAFISQENHIFHRTLLENITFGVSHYSQYELEEALNATELSLVVQSLPEGLESPVGEGGLLLSGGEKQRLSLARAWLLKPDVLILDEATHSIDNDLSKRILKRVVERFSTVVLVSHQPFETHIFQPDQVLNLDHLAT